MSVGIRVQCDAPGCRRHFEVDARVEGLRVASAAAPTRTTVRDPRASVWLDGPVACPQGWAVRDGTLYCADHA